jgi:hypothetical protein
MLPQKTFQQLKSKEAHSTSDEDAPTAQSISQIAGMVEDVVGVFGMRHNLAIGLYFQT